jgi:hypothetical protein
MPVRQPFHHPHWLNHFVFSTWCQVTCCGVKWQETVFTFFHFFSFFADAGVGNKQRRAWVPPIEVDWCSHIQPDPDYPPSLWFNSSEFAQFSSLTRVTQSFHLQVSFSSHSPFSIPPWPFATTHFEAVASLSLFDLVFWTCFVSFIWSHTSHLSFLQ